MRLGISFWTPQDDISALLAETAEQLGQTAVAVDPMGPLPAGLDALLIHGPQGSPLPLAFQLQALPADERPRLAVWQTEQFWNPAWPTWLARLASDARAAVERYGYQRHGQAVWQRSNRWSKVTRRAFRLRYFGELRWLRRTGLLTALAATSQWMAGFLARTGLPASLAYFGVYPCWGADLGLDRDIDVLWVGKVGTDRRQKLLEQVRSALAQRGITMVVVDGVEHPYVFGEARTALLNRAKVVLNLLRQPWDNHSLRFFLAAANRAMVISEPTLPHLPYQNGVHVVYAGLRELPDVMTHYCRAEAERQRIADEMHRYTFAELTVAKGLSNVLSAVAATPGAPQAMPRATGPIARAG